MIRLILIVIYPPYEYIYPTYEYIYILPMNINGCIPIVMKKLDYFEGGKYVQ